MSFEFDLPNGIMHLEAGEKKSRGGGEFSEGKKRAVKRLRKVRLGVNSNVGGKKFVVPVRNKTGDVQCK